MSVDDSSASSRRTRGRRNELPEELRPRQQRGQSPGNASAGGSSITTNGGRARSRSRSPGVMQTPVVRRPAGGATPRDRPVPTVSIVPEESLSNVTVQPDLTQQTFTSTQTTQLMEQTTAHKRQKKQQSVDPSPPVPTSSSAATAILMASLNQPSVLSPPPARVVATPAAAAAAATSNTNRQRQKGTHNWTKEEILLLVETVRHHLPAGSEGWSLVAELYNEQAAVRRPPLVSRNSGQLKKKHFDLSRATGTTGNPTMSPFIRQSKKTDQLILQRYQVQQSAGPPQGQFFGQDDPLDDIDVNLPDLPRACDYPFHYDDDDPIDLVNLPGPPAAAANILPAAAPNNSPPPPPIAQVNNVDPRHPRDQTVTPAHRKRRAVDAHLEQIHRLAKEDKIDNNNMQSTLVAMLQQQQEDSKRRDEQFREEMKAREHQRLAEIEQRKIDAEERKKEAKEAKDEHRLWMQLVMRGMGLIKPVSDEVPSRAPSVLAVAPVPLPSITQPTPPEAQRPIQETSIASSMPPLTQH